MESLFSNLDDLIRVSKEKAEKNLRECISNVRTDFAGIAKILSLYHPLEVLKLSVWEAKRNAAKKDVFARTCLNLMPFLLQSIVCSEFYDTKRISHNRDIKSKDWNRIISLTEAVTRKLIRYIDNLTVLQVKNSVISFEDARLYRENLAVLYFPPFESVERIESQYYPLRAALSSAEYEVEEKFGVSSEVLANGFRAIAEDSIDSIDRLIKDVQVFKSEVMQKMVERREEGKDLELSEEALTKKIISENKWQGRSLSLAGKRDDFDLFRPEFATNLPKQAFDAISTELGSLDLNSSLLAGYWPASLKPYIKMGDFYFSFIAKHLVSCGNRIMMDTLNIYNAPTRASQEACALLFTKTDVLDVYSFDGNKIDLIVLPSLSEANPDANPEHFASRVSLREEEKKVKRQIGHTLLFVDPDSPSKLEKIGEQSFSTSASFLIESALDSDKKKAFLRTMFGVLSLPESEKTFAEALEEDYFLPADAECMTDPDGKTSDDYEYALTEDEEDAIIEEKEKKVEEASPELVDDSVQEDELEDLRDIYELTDELIAKDEENSTSYEKMSKEIDYDDFDDEELEEDDVDDYYPEEIAFYDEAEAIDEYQTEEVEESDILVEEPNGESVQLDFLNLLEEEPAKEAPAEAPVVEVVEEPKEEIVEESIQESIEEPVVIAEETVEESEEVVEPATEEAPSCVEEVVENTEDTPVLEEEPCVEVEQSSFEEASEEEVVNQEETAVEEPVEEVEEVVEPATEEAPSCIEEVVENTEDSPVLEEEPCIEVEDPSFEEAEEEIIEQEEAAIEEPLKEAEEVDEPVIEEAPKSSPLSWAQSMFGDILGMGNSSEETVVEESAEEVVEEPVVELEDVAEDVISGGPTDEPVAEEATTEEESVVEEPAQEPIEEPVEEPSEEEEDAPEPYYVGEDGSTVVRDKDGTFILRGHASTVEELMLPTDDFDKKEEEVSVEKLDGILLKIKKALNMDDAVFLTFLDEADEEMITYMHNLFSESWQRQQLDHKDKVFSIFDYSLTVLLTRNPIRDDLRLSELLNNAGAVMYSRGKEEWNALILFINDEYEVETALEKHISKNTFSAFDWKRVTNIGEQLLARGRN